MCGREETRLEVKNDNKRLKYSNRIRDSNIMKAMCYELKNMIKLNLRVLRST